MTLRSRLTLTPLTHLSAQELNDYISRARGGCVESLGDLLEFYKSYLSLIARMQMGNQLRSKFSTSDIVQGTFLQAQRCFSDFNGSCEGEWISWLRKILASQLATEVRRYSTQCRDVALERRIHSELDESSLLLASVLGGREGSPSQITIRRERAVLLADALDKLPDDYREVIVLKHLRGRNFAQIASQLDRTVDSVKGIWRRAIPKLRELLGDGVL